MSSENRLSARIRTDIDDGIQALGDDHDMVTAEAERTAVKAGLHTLGYYDIPEPQNPADRLRYWVNWIGMVLGFVGLILTGYGIFGSLIFRVMGFGVLLIGVLLIATQALLHHALPTQTDRENGISVDEVLHAR